MSDDFMKMGLPTLGDLRRWRKERERMMAAEKDLKRRRLALDKFIEAGEAVISAHAAPEPSDSAQLHKEAEGPVKPATQRVRRKRGKTWTAVILKIVTASDRGITYPEMKEEVEKTHLGETLQKTDKALYGGVGRLAEKGEIIKHKGRIYSRKAYAQFQRDIAAGTAVDDWAPVQTHDSPAKIAIFDFLRSRSRGATTAQIISALRMNPNTKEAVERNKTPVYNLLARLVRRAELIKQGKVYRVPEPKNEAPDSSESSATPHNGSGGGTSLSSGNEAQPLAALPGANPADPGP